MSLGWDIFRGSQEQGWRQRRRKKGDGSGAGAERVLWLGEVGERRGQGEGSRKSGLNAWGEGWRFAETDA